MPHVSVDRRSFFKTAAGTVAAGSVYAQNAANSNSPNVIIIVADDLGYGDLNSYGSKFPTPNLTTMAQQGIQLSEYYSPSPVCSPSRAAMLTGRYAPRTGVTDVLQGNSTAGLSASETTIAQMLKGAGYSTMCVGKWHLGSLPEFMPTNHGFDQYYGLPVSVDMDPLPLMQNTTVIEQPANLNTLTQRYTQQAVGFIAKATGPFFLYMAHAFPHLPVATSTVFTGVTGMGRYADTLAEIDWSVGQVLQALRANNLDHNTLVIFTSDHGPWYQGSPGNLRGRKGETFEGGMRVPFIARFPGRIPAGQVNSTGFASGIDLLPTIAYLTGTSVSANLDGINVWPMLSGARDTAPRELLLYIDSLYVQAARLGPWKLHVARYNTPPWVPVAAAGRWNLPLHKPELYNLVGDPGETSDVAADYPHVVTEIQARINAMIPGLPPQMQSAWNMTKNTAVCDTPTGSWPTTPN